MILHVISGLGVGGAEAVLVQLAGALHDRGLPQHVVGLRGGENAARLAERGVPVTDLGLTGMADSAAGLLRLRRLVRDRRPSVIHGWMYHGNIAAALVHRLAPGRRDRRLFWGLRASNMDEQRYAGINRVGAWLSGWPDVLIANSAAGARAHVDLGYRPRTLEIIPNGIDTARFRFDPGLRSALRQEIGIPSDAVVAIHVARVDPMKDHETFLAALHRTPGVTGLLVGLGTETLRLPTNARALGLRRDVGRLYGAADLVVSSSSFGEGFSNVIAEGMSAGLVPVATDVGDAGIIVGETGTVVPPRSAELLASALAQEAARPAAERALRGQAARARIEAEFGLDRMIEAHARIYAAAGRSVS